MIKPLLVFSLLLLSGCVSVPPLEDQALLMPGALQSSEEIVAENSLFSKGQWPEKDWWQALHDTELTDCIELALLHNPSIQRAASRLQKAKQVSIKARSKLFPLLFFDADANWQYLSKNGLYRTLNPSIPASGDLVDLSLSFDYEIDFWSKNRNIFRAALGNEKAEEAELSQVRLMITTAVAQSYFAYKTNKVRQRIYKRLYSTYSNIYHLQELLERNALLSKLPVYLSGEGLEEAYKEVEQIEQETQASLHMLNILMGQNPETLQSISLALQPPPDELLIPENIPTDLVSRRPDLMASIWQAQALCHEVGAAVADFYPQVNLKGLAGLESFELSNLFDWASRTAGLIPSIHLPIFTAGEIRANLDSRKAELDEAVSQYNDLLLQSFSEVSNAIIFADTVYEKKQSQERILRLARARNHLTDMRVQSGLDSYIEAYNVKIELLEKELEEVLLTYNQYLAVIQLVKSLGGGYLSDFIIPIKEIENGTERSSTIAE